MKLTTRRASCAALSAALLLGAAGPGHARANPVAGGSGAVADRAVGGEAATSSFAPADDYFLEAAPALSNPPVGPGGWDAKAYARELGDVNGDGKTDIVFFGNDGTTVALARDGADGFDLEPVWPRFGTDAAPGLWGTQTRRLLADVNGDGRADIVGFHKTGVFLAHREDTGYVYKSLVLPGKFGFNAGWDLAVHPVVLDDVNGDGKADIIGFWHDGVHLALAKADGSGWHSPNRVLTTFHQTYQNPPYLRGLTGDVNGDGKADLIGFDQGGTVVALANAGGDGFDLQPTYPKLGANDKWTTAKHPRLVGDVDGDGWDDIVGFANNVVAVLFSDGAGGFAFEPNAFTATFCYVKGGWRVGTHPRLLADIDGDGRADIVGFAGSGTYVALAKPDRTGFQDHRKAEDAYGADWEGGGRTRALADVTGDGAADIIGFGQAEVFCSLATGWDLQAMSELGKWETAHAPRMVLHMGYALAVFAGKPSSQGATGIHYSVREADGSWSPPAPLEFPTGVPDPRLGEDLGPGAGAGHATLIGAPVTLASTPDSPLRVLSDGRHLYLFRQGADGFLYADRFVFDQATGALNRAREVRYQKSRKKYEPMDAWDSLGASDKNGNAFYEPTIKLLDIANLQDGWFDVLLMPTAIAGEEYWKVFAYESGSGSLDVHSIRRGADGWFDFADRTVNVGMNAQGGSSAVLLVGHDRFRLAPAALGSSSLRGTPVAIDYKDQISDGGTGAVFAGLHVMLAVPTDSGVQLVDLPLLQNGAFAVLDRPLARNATVDSALPSARMDRFPGQSRTPRAWRLDTGLQASGVTLLESADGRVHLRYDDDDRSTQPEWLYDALGDGWVESSPVLPAGAYPQHSALEIGTIAFTGKLARGSMDRISVFRGASGSLAVLNQRGVAELESTYLGQNHLDSTLVGYIEGAPPVPGENLTEQATYEGAIEVSLVATQSSEQTWSRELGTGSDFNLYAKVLVVAVSLDTSRGWLQGDSVSTQQTITTVNPVRLTGVGAGADPSCPAAGNQWCPRNIGVAVLESSFADIYALRKRGESALYSYYMRPSDSGPQTQVLTFQINPHYTKQGVLDGWTGTAPHPDFGLQAGQVSSYRKDDETARWTEQIERRREELEQHYAQSVSNPWAMRARRMWTDSEVAAWNDNKEKASQRSFVNEYDWDASSGSLYTREVEQVMSSGSVLGGSYDWKMQGGYGISTSAGEGVSIETFAFNLMIGGHINRNFQSSDQDTEALTISVDESGLERNGILDLNGLPLTAGEKVDHYSWKTFHLEADQEHFEDFYDRVVDPIWLTGNSAAAKALRASKQTAISNPVWRVVHRVDYVSRPYAEVPEGAPETGGDVVAGAAPAGRPLAGAGEPVRLSAAAIRAQKAAGIHSPWQLVKRVDPSLVAAARSREELEKGIQLGLDTLEPMPDRAVRLELEGYLLHHFESRLR